MRIADTRFVLLAGLAAWGISAGLCPADAADVRPVKEFQINVTEVAHELFPGGPKIMAWGFNGQVPGPPCASRRGDLVCVHFTNNHTSNHTLHFHGINLSNEMDGVAYGPLR